MNTGELIGLTICALFLGILIFKITKDAKVQNKGGRT